VIDNLRVTELMFEPSSSSRAEFIELKNISTSKTLDLSGVTFSSGITYTFPAGTTLAPGAYTVLTESLSNSRRNSPESLQPNGPVASSTIPASASDWRFRHTNWGSRFRVFRHLVSHHIWQRRILAVHRPAPAPRHMEHGGELAGEQRFRLRWRASVRGETQDLTSSRSQD
jgi:hypothetical protein